MEQLLATRSISITELKRSPSTVIAQAGAEPVAILNHNRPAAYLLSAAAYETLMGRLAAELQRAIQEGMDSGASIAGAAVEAELLARYADPAEEMAREV